MPAIAIAILADESLRVAEGAEHHGVVDGDAGQGERQALEEAADLKQMIGLL